MYLIEFNNPELLNISLEDKIRVVNTIMKDSDFLCNQNIMDYSLLIAIEKLDQDESSSIH